MTHTTQGNIGEAIAISELTKQGYTISIPLTNNNSYDLVVEKEGVFNTVQVKTSSVSKTEGSWSVYIATSGGNTRKNVIKKFDKDAVDYLFVVNSLYECWLIPTEVVVEKSYLTVSPTKFHQYKL